MESRSVVREHPAVQGMRSTLVGIGVNGLLALIKATAGFLGNSYALVADAIESLTDVFSSIVVWLGLRYAAQPPDQNHPYGHGKGEPLAATVVSVGLFVAAVGIAVQSIHEICTPHHAPAAFTLGVLVLVVVVKEGLFRFVFRVGREANSTAVKTDAWHHRSDAITSAAAFIGISISLIGGRGWESADDWAALFASGIIVLNAYRLLIPALAELTDASPDPALGLRVRELALQVPGVLSLHRCLVRKMGFDYFVDLDVRVDPSMSVGEAHQIAHRVQDVVRAGVSEVVRVLVHIEPEGGPVPPAASVGSAR